MHVKRRRLPNFESCSVALFASLALYGPLRWPAGIPTRPEVDQMAGGTKPGEFLADVARLVSDGLNSTAVVVVDSLHLEVRERILLDRTIERRRHVDRPAIAARAAGRQAWR